jgi:beta-lactamase class D
MTLDRRTFTRSLALVTGATITGILPVRKAMAAPAHLRATVIADAATGRILHRSGACATRFSPCSTFKIPLALIGFDAGILKSAHDPAWDYRPEVFRGYRAEEKQRTDPSTWESNSVVWYSQELTTRLGAAKFKAYIDRFGYGNRDLRGNPGKNDGLTQAWLGSSLLVSPDDQVAFLRRMLAHRLVSAQAHALAESIIPRFEGSGGWQVQGKTGSGWLDDARTTPMGWFVGWATKGKRRIVHASFEAEAGRKQLNGRDVREMLLKGLGGLAG